MTDGSMFGKEDEYDEYPHKDVDFSVKLIVEDALKMAWNRLIENQRRYGIDLDKCDEKFISEKLRDILEDIIKAEYMPGFTCEYFQTISREEHLRNFNRSSIDKQPDLIFRFYSVKIPLELNIKKRDIHKYLLGLT
jgi:hypothetical protein